MAQVQLANAHGEAEALRNAALDFVACGRHVVLTVIQHEGEHFPAQNGRVAVALLDEGVLAFVLDTTRVAGTRWYDASERGSVFVPLRRLLRVPPVEQSLAWLPAVLDIDLTTPRLMSPSPLSFPSFLPFLSNQSSRLDKECLSSQNSKTFQTGVHVHRPISSLGRDFPHFQGLGIASMPRCASIWSNKPP